MHRYHALVVGLGRIGLGYDVDAPPELVRTHARAFAQHPRFRLVGGVDPDPAARATFEHLYGVRAWPDLAAAAHAEVVAVGVPTELHRAQVAAALVRGGLRAVLCEKPLAASVAEAQGLIDDCRSAGVPLYVNFLRRAVPGLREVKRRLQVGAISGPVKGVVWYSKGLRHNGSHFIDLLIHWLGPVQQARTIAPGRRLGVEPHADAEPDIQLRLAAGEVVMLAAAEEHFSHYTVELLAANGRLRLERGGASIGWQPAQVDARYAGYRSLGAEEPIAAGMERYQWHVADLLARALDGQSTPLATGEEALATARVVESLLEQT